MTTLRKIDASPFKAKLKLAPPIAGAKPLLRWIAIECLRVDPVYQRTIMERGVSNIIKIAEAFDWLKFAPVVVAEAEAGLFLVIDGQHRTTAAALRGIKDVPCAIVKATKAQQAAAFAAINAQVTQVTPWQLHAARLAAGDKDAAEIADVCARAGVTVCRYPVPASKMRPGETLAIGALARCLKLYGADVLVAALSCVVKSKPDGNIGMLRQQAIRALCAVLDGEPAWCKSSKRLIAAMATFDFERAWTEAGTASFAERCSMESKLIEMVADHLDRKLGAVAA